MSATLSPSPKQQFFDANGAPLVGGKLYSYTAGTTSPLATYVDSAGTTTNTNPIILDSRGEANVWLGANTYKLALYSATDVLIWTVDDITAASADTLAALAASGGSSLIGYLPSGTGAVATTVQTKLRETVSVKDFGAVGDGVTDDTAAIQAAVDAAEALADAGTSGRAKVVASAGGYYKLASSVQLKGVTLDASGASFLLTGTSGFLVGVDSAFISASTLIQCEAGYTGSVFKKDPAEASVVTLNMIGKARIDKLGATDTSAGIGVDMTAFHRSNVDVEVRNMATAIYASPASSADQTYYNRISVRGSTLANGIYLVAGTYSIVNGNMFEYVSFGTVEYGIRLLQSGGSNGPGSNTFHIAYIEKATVNGINVNGVCEDNKFFGGLIENGASNDVVCIDFSNGAKYNFLAVSVEPNSVAKALQAIGCTRNTFYLQQYGNYIDWSADIGPSSTLKTASNQVTFVGGMINQIGYQTHNSATATVDVSNGKTTIVLSGSGTITGCDAAGFLGVNEITFIGNGSATIQNNAAVTYPFRVFGGANVTPPAESRITFQRLQGYSNSWWEKSRSF